MKKTLVYALGMIAVLSSCTNEKYERLSDGVIVNLNTGNKAEAKKVRLQVVNNRIIHVSATPEKRFADKESLIRVAPFDDLAEWKIEEKGDSLYLSTSEVTAAISLTSGEILFTDQNGKTLLREARGGKQFAPFKADGFKGYSFSTIFESTLDEAFYGLGQHQADEFNYKGKNEELFQYNTKVSVPFLVSNKNYGLLWDNYSLGRFGDNRPYDNLNQFRLFDKSGNEGALTATYYENSNKSASVFTERREAKIDYETIFSNNPLPAHFDFGGEVFETFPEGYKFDNGLIVWEGEIEPMQSGQFNFILYYAGYTKVFIGGQEAVEERWRTAWNPNSYKFTANLESGKKTPVRLEWKPDGGASYISLKALSPKADTNDKLQMWFEMGQQMDYYFIAGSDMDQVISGYRNLTGKASIMPKWAMGFWQSRERYKTSTELLGALTELRKRKIGIDNIVLDWSYWEEDQWGAHDMDPKRFPDPKAMIDSVHDMNAQIMISVWPKFYCNTEHYKEFDEKGYMYQQAVKDSIRDWIGHGYVGSFYDAYAPEAREIFWDQMNEHIYSLGMDAWWMDASEPNVRDCTPMSYRKALCGPTALGAADEYFNTYSLVNADAIYTGQRKENPDDRVFLLTRSGFAGLQRYSTVTWSGDIGTRWEEMKAQISAGLNFSMSGIPYWTMDIGGFCVEKRYEEAQRIFDHTGVENDDLKEWRELNARWYQFGTFTPLYRAHGQFPLREIYNIAPDNHPAYKTIADYNRLRYRMMPYIYSMCGHTYFNDYTIMRPLVMDFSSDKRVENISTQYMYGPALMVCPVYEYKAKSREVYFPQGSSWYDFYTGKAVEGSGSKIVDAPYDRMPLFVRAGSIVPFGPEIQYVNEKKPELVTLYVYAGADGKFSLYEDEGTNYNYEKGKYTNIDFSYNDASRTLEISRRNGEFDGMLQNRKFNVVLVSPEKAVSSNIDRAKGKVVEYSGDVVLVKL